MPSHAEIPAIILLGDEPMFRKDAERLQDYLIAKAGYSQDNIRALEGRKVRDLPLLSDFVARFAGAPLLLAYVGHGSPNYIAPTNQCRIPYHALARWAPEQVLFVNDTCYAETAIPAFEEHGRLTRGAVIAATSENAYAYNEVFLNHLLQSAQQHRKFVRRRIGARYVQGDVTIIGDPGTQDTEDADRIIGATLEITISSLPTIQERSYMRPVPVGKIQYPRRAGKPLDHLLYSMVREAAKPGNSKIVRDVDPSQSMKPRR